MNTAHQWTQHYDIFVCLWDLQNYFDVQVIKWKGFAFRSQLFLSASRGHNSLTTPLTSRTQQLFPFGICLYVREDINCRFCKGGFSNLEQQCATLLINSINISIGIKFSWADPCFWSDFLSCQVTQVGNSEKLGEMLDLMWKRCQLAINVRRRIWCNLHNKKVRRRL